MRLFACCLAVTLAVGSSPAAAQFPATLAPGARVRVLIADSTRQPSTRPQEHWVVGSVLARAADTLYLGIPNVAGSLAVPRAGVRALDVSRGVTPRKRGAAQDLRYTVLGALMFFGAHALGDQDTFGSRGGATLLGGVVGFGAGRWLAARPTVEQWQAVPLDR